MIKNKYACDKLHGGMADILRTFHLDKEHKDLSQKLFKILQSHGCKHFSEDENSILTPHGPII